MRSPDVGETIARTVDLGLLASFDQVFLLWRDQLDIRSIKKLVKVGVTRRV